MNERDKIRCKIKKAISKQMKEKSLDRYAHYEDLAKDYLSLWDIKNRLIDDIAERGVSVKWCNGGGQEGHKKNESISELLKVNKQMLTILYDLGIRASDLKVVDEDDNL